MRLILFGVLILGFLSNTKACSKCLEEPEVIINCYGKYFHCVNQTHFYQCANYGPITLAFSSQEIQECPGGLICSDANKWECVEPTESSTTTECPNDTTTEIQTTVTQDTSSTKLTNVPTVITPASDNSSDVTSPKSTHSVTPKSTSNPTTSASSKNDSDYSTPSDRGPGISSDEPETIEPSSDEPNKTTELSFTTSTSDGFSDEPSEATEPISTISESATSTSKGSSSTESGSGGSSDEPSETTEPSSATSESATSTPEGSSSTAGGSGGSSDEPSETTESSSATSESVTSTSEGSSSTDGGSGGSSDESSSTTFEPATSTSESYSSTSGSSDELSSTTSESITNTTEVSTEAGSKTPPGGSTIWPPKPTDFTDYSGPTSESSSLKPGFRCHSAGKYPDNVSCHKYHICVDLFHEIVDLEGDCPPGTNYDAFENQCTTLPVQCPGEPQLNCTRDGTFAHPHKCNRYYTCDFNYVFDRYDLKQYLCPYGQAYDEESDACIGSARCRQDPQRNFSCSEIGSFPVERNCTSFYECTLDNRAKFVQTTKTCGDNALFDRVRRRCRRSCLVTNCPYNNIDIE